MSPQFACKEHYKASTFALYNYTNQWVIRFRPGSRLVFCLILLFPIPIRLMFKKDTTGPRLLRQYSRWHLSVYSVNSETSLDNS